MTLFRIAGGTVYDPRNGIDGEVRDLWTEDGRMVAPPSDPDRRPDKTLDAGGSKLDFASRAHLTESKSRLDRALNAQFSAR